MSEPGEEPGTVRRVGLTPLVQEEADLEAGGGAARRTNRLRGWLMGATAGSPVLQEHALAVTETAQRAARAPLCWLVLLVCTVLLLHGAWINHAIERDVVALKPRVQYRHARKYHARDFEEQRPDGKNLTDAPLVRFDDQGNASFLRLDNNMNVEYTPEEKYELLWTYLSYEKAWPYVGSERYLDQFNATSRHYYNSLAVFPYNNRTRLHGLAGINPNGTRSWTPAPMPPPIEDAPEGKDEALKNGGFYLALSNALPMDRDVPDIRPEVCKHVKFDLNELEDVSVIITYYNEHVSTLLRSVHSVLNFTPPPLLREIILVDDYSNSTGVDAGSYLDEYVKLLPKTKILRLPERRGLVRARLAGAKIAKAPVIVVLDSHIEVNVGWLEPQLQRLKESPKSVVFPQIMSLDPEKFTYRNDSGISCFLSFKWMMQERPYFNPPKTPEPVASPSMAGGLFAVRRDWFFDIGGYDEEFKMWGAENVEMGFRYWMCGGRVECMPCSWTYHIYRHGGTGYKSPGEYVARNRLRTAMLWTGPYWQLAKQFIDTTKGLDVGSFEKMNAIKRKHKCKSFDWYLKHVDSSRYGIDSSEYGLVGEIRSGKGAQCLDSMQSKNGGTPVGIFGCHGQRGAQGWMEITTKRQIRNMASEFICVGRDLQLTHCDQPDNDGVWRSVPGKQWLAAARSAKLAQTSTNWAEDYQCLALTGARKLELRACKEDDAELKWVFSPLEWDPDFMGPEGVFNTYEYDDLPFDYERTSASDYRKAERAEVVYKEPAHHADQPPADEGEVVDPADDDDDPTDPDPDLHQQHHPGIDDLRVDEDE